MGEKAYGFFPDVEDEAYGLIKDFYRMWRTRLTDCLRICTGFGGGGLRIVYGFGPDLVDRIVYGLDRIWWTGFGGEGSRIVYGFLPDVEDEAYGLFTDFFPDVEDEAALLFSRATWFVGNKGFLEHKV